MRLADKVILITGSYTGIGKAIAQECIKQGAKVVLNGLDEKLGQVLMNELATEKSIYITADISLPNTPQILINETLKKFGKLDALVNNAAMIVSSDIETTDKNLVENVLKINTIAPLMLIQEALPHLQKARGNVLNIGSINAWGGEPNLLAYSISKGALMTMTRNLGDSLLRTHGVRVNQINPGWVLTEREVLGKIEQGLPENWYEDISDIFAPAHRIFSPAEIAAAAIYWLSDECGPVSAQVMDLEQFPVVGRNLSKNIKYST
jgi:NAD(P)-dependent dehydrogenase (short-subunit alcohol dehydrogenase family)